ncbi:MAG: hypothetical protein QME85_04675 [Candidatus Saccharicenans sp.]|nr:hypothetical protein [Candidatus Saccharicenans sp.]
MDGENSSYGPTGFQWISDDMFERKTFRKYFRPPIIFIADGLNSGVFISSKKNRREDVKTWPWPSSRQNSNIKLSGGLLFKGRKRWTS